MKTVVITSQKGGTGKTTLTAHLAVAAAHDKAGRTVVIDTDPQNTLAKSGFDYCLIDTPPALTKQNREVLRLANLVIIPTRPSPNDLWALGATLDLVKESGTPFVFALTQAKGNARITVQTIAALSQH